MADMALLQLLLLSLLFLASLLSLYFRLPSTTTKKLLAWLTQKSPAPSPKSSSASKKKSSINTGKTVTNGEEIKQVFHTFDKNKDGFITKQELGESLEKMGISTGDDEVRKMLEKLDSNGDGLIDLDEFSGIFDCSSSLGDREERDAELEVGIKEEEGDLKEAFDVFDGDRDGLITVEELGLVLSALGLKEGKRVEACKEMIRKVDVDGDGMVNFDEFKRMMRASNGGARLIPAF